MTVVKYGTGMVSHDGGETYHVPDPNDPKDAAWLERTRAALERSMMVSEDAPTAKSGHLKYRKRMGA